MAKVSFQSDRVAPPTDAKIEEIGVIALATGRPIKLRIQPDLYNADKQRYDSWSGANWTLELDDVEEGKRFLDGLEAYMRAFGDPKRQAETLRLLGVK